MFCKIRQQLFLGFVGIRNEFLPRSESQSAHITIGDAWRGPHKSHDLHISFSHANIIAGEKRAVKFGPSPAFWVVQAGRETFSEIHLTGNPMRMRGEEPSSKSNLISHHEPEKQA